MMKKKQSVFSESDLSKLPLTYRLMTSEKVDNVGELYINTFYTKSKKHFSNNYMVYNLYKPISNFSTFYNKNND